MNKLVWVLLLIVATVGCKSSEEFTGFSYDPPDVTNTKDKEIEEQHYRVIGAGTPKIWVSNEFDGARLNDFYAINDSVYQVLIKPENAPINNSPWYAFKIWSDSAITATIQLAYNDAQHRYVPKLSTWNEATEGWETEKEITVQFDSSTGTAQLQLELTNEPVVISGQPLHTSKPMMQTLQDRGVLEPNYVKHREAGKSKQGRSIYELEITEVNDGQKAPVLAIIGRQHPPEVTGYLASLYFLEELVAKNDLSRKFRETFVIKAYPMINPDGVDMGHWRHNAGGIDLNRDWENFNQPETQVVRDALTPLKENKTRRMFYAIDFHSTNENIFYPIDEEVETSPDNITQKWTDEILEDNPDIEFTIEEFDTSSPIAKNWFYREFGIDAVTYEVNDQMSEETIESVSRSAARSLMELLLKEWENNADNF